jgi:hypothetical protein
MKTKTCPVTGDRIPFYVRAEYAVGALRELWSAFQLDHWEALMGNNHFGCWPEELSVSSNPQAIEDLEILQEWNWHGCRVTLVAGHIDAYENPYGVDQVSYYADYMLVFASEEEPYEWECPCMGTREDCLLC